VNISKLAAALMAGAGLIGVSNAGVIDVPAGDIITSTTWTANNTYRLKGIVYVTGGATLTIEPGTVIASIKADTGSLVITRGSKIIADGTATNPIIFTSTDDVATWKVDVTHPTGKNPKSGALRAGAGFGANEWGNLTIMGNAYISEGSPASLGNSPSPSATNIANMEGLSSGTSKDQYGGGDDEDDSGSLSYVSLRYGGRTLAPGVELNGLSLGGIGRATDINHIEIMNNLDDGIEVWGGTVNFKYLSIWNVGDDSFDLDQGWRGKAQFGLVVQGYSTNASQGSGVGDNMIEADGAEFANYQPVTSATLYNWTLIGQPGSTGGDHGVALRDNARLQVRNSIFMDIGEQALKNDGDAGEGQGGFNVLTFNAEFSTPYNTYSPVNPPVLPLTYADLYKAQVDGNLSELRDSVFYNNNFATAYADAIGAGVFTAGPVAQFDNVLATNSPIKKIVRGAQVNPSGALLISPVVALDPRAANDALTSIGQAPNDGFFDQVSYRGAFDATTNWCLGWTAADAFCLFDVATATVRTGVNNVPSSLTAVGLPTLGNATFGFQFHNPTASCGVGPGSFVVTSLNFNGPLNFPFLNGCSGGSGTVLINIFGGIPSLNKNGIWLGAPATASYAIPNDTTLCGIAASAQSFFVVGAATAIVPSDAVDIVIGQ
jgi:hypothetical protein